MATGGRPDRERLEVFLLNFLLSRRPIWFGFGIVLLIYGVAAFVQYPIPVGASLVLGAYTMALANSYQLVLLTARFGAWLWTRWKS